LTLATVAVSLIELAVFDVDVLTPPESVTVSVAL
jgi:hypothetical protein